MAQFTRLAISFAILMTAAPSLAQSGNESDDRHSPRYDVGAAVAPWFLAYVDEEATHPPSVWVTIPAGRLTIQLDYLRSVRGEPLWYLEYPQTDGSLGYEEARTSHHVEQVFSAAVKWPVRRLGRGGYLLLGGAWQYYTDRWCTAFNVGDRSERGARLDFPPGFECSSTPADVVHQMFAPLYGVGWDLPLGSRFFGSVQYRARWVPYLGELRVGVGYRF